jgi:hypothetical protein
MAVTIVGGTFNPTIPLGTAVTVSGSTYNFLLTDTYNVMVELTNATSCTATIQPNSTTSIPIGSQIYLLGVGAGTYTIAPGSGVTLNGTPGLKLRAQWSAATLVKRGTDSWVLVGDVSE